MKKKERLWKEARERYQNISEEEKEKVEKRPIKNFLQENKTK